MGIAQATSPAAKMRFAKVTNNVDIKVVQINLYIYQQHILDMNRIFLCYHCTTHVLFQYYLDKTLRTQEWLTVIEVGMMLRIKEFATTIVDG